MEGKEQKEDEQNNSSKFNVERKELQMKAHRRRDEHTN